VVPHLLGHLVLMAVVVHMLTTQLLRLGAHERDVSLQVTCRSSLPCRTSPGVDPRAAARGGISMSSKPPTTWC